jgi:lysophospholipase L1-like esterase
MGRMSAERRKSMAFRFGLAALILLLQFAVLEAGLRVYGSVEGTTTFQSLFMSDPVVGIRLRPDAKIKFTTVEFTAEIAINAQGVRDDAPIGPKPPGERRIVVLGDSLVLSVQVSLADTFCERLERQLNARGGPERWRVINAGVQGYGPVQEWFFFDKVAAAFEPDVVLIVAFVGNDAIEAADAEAALDAGHALADPQPALNRMRRIVRSSVVLQYVRLRWDQLKSRFVTGTPERPLASYLTDPPPIVRHGIDVSRRAFGQIATRAGALGAPTGLVLMPARFQTNDVDFGNLSAIVREAGGVLDRHASSRRFEEGLAPLGLPLLDLQPILFNRPDREGLFYQRTVHLTPLGHEAVAGALFDFVRQSGLVPPGG